MRILILLFLSGSLFALDLQNLKVKFAEAGVFRAGDSLVDLKPGIHFLNERTKTQQTLFIAIHGFQTEGYEWVYPLLNINSTKNHIAFYRWKTNGCPNFATDNLHKIINEQKNNYSKIVLMGHSYGGIVVAQLLEKNYETPIEMHIIATGIAGERRLNNWCGYVAPKKTGNNVEAYQWMTIKELDGAFKNLKTDTQIQNIEGVSPFRLPEEYKGNKLSHNWSISWVIDNLNSK